MAFLNLTITTYQNIHHSCLNDDAALAACGPHVVTLLKELTFVPLQTCTEKEVDVLQTLATDLQKTAYRKIHTYPFSSVPLCWRQLYADTGIITAILLVWKYQKSIEGSPWDEIESAFIQTLDMVLIMTGAPGPSREEWIHELLSSISTYTPTTSRPRPAKRKKLSPPSSSNIDIDLRTLPSSPTPEIKFPIPRYTNLPSLPAFRAHVNQSSPTPFIINNLASSWPATNENPWYSTEYLLSVTSNGKRLVPVEVGEAYTSEDWGQEIISFKNFLDKYILQDDTSENNRQKRGYLAQHSLLRQIPALRNDISIPDYCFISPRSSTSEEEAETDTEPKEPILNTWFGPPSTVSPLHTDPHHNILLNVFGRKYIRLYPPSETPQLFPRQKGEDGIDMSNTSSIPWEMVEGGMDGFDIGGVKGLGNGIDVEDVLKYWDAGRFGEVEYVECVLGEREGLFLPKGWWHYVRGLSCCFSVSMWWD